MENRWKEVKEQLVVLMNDEENVTDQEHLNDDDQMKLTRTSMKLMKMVMKRNEPGERRMVDWDAKPWSLYSMDSLVKWKMLVMMPTTTKRSKMVILE